MERAPVPYAAIRARAWTGDVVLWRGENLLGKAIRLWSDGFSHASLVVRVGGGLRERVAVVEALGDGLAFRWLSLRLGEFTGQAFLLHLPHAEDDTRRAKAWDMAMDLLGRGIPYDYSALFRNMGGRTEINGEAYFCSEFVYDVLAKAELALHADTAPRPGDLPQWVRGELLEIDKPEAGNGGQAG